MAFRHALRPIAPFLILLALAARLLVPAGFMPATGADGVTRLVMCSGMGPIEAPAEHIAHGASHQMAMDHGDGTMPADHPDGQGDHACPFAVVAHAVDLGAGLADPVLYSVVVAAAAVPILFVRPGLGLAAPPPPKTGPPAQS
jgi:hypothetical protein